MTYELHFKSFFGDNLVP